IEERVWHPTQKMKRRRDGISTINTKSLKKNLEICARNTTTDTLTTNTQVIPQPATIKSCHPNPLISGVLI
ncbi:hypothetical protein ACFLS1_12570, partial [Verrucomicrobiota bacterium]